MKMTSDNFAGHARRACKEIFTAHTVIVVLLVVTLALLAFNQVAIAKLGATVTAVEANSNPAANSVSSATLGPDVIPKGVPSVYGQELGVSYDDVSPNDQAKADTTIRKLAMLDVGINLTGEKLQRYITITNQISCEYCCGAKAITFSDGRPACGCAHSYAMRGVAKYLLDKHPTEFTNDQILEELGKWKTLFFPGIMTQKAQVLQQQGITLNYIDLASNKYRGIEQGTASGGGMVGGC